MKDSPGDHRHQHPRCQRFKKRDDQHFATGLLDDFLFKKFAYAKSDEGQGQITDKAQILYHICRNHIKPAGADQNARQNIAADLGQIQGVGQPGHDKTGKKYDR